jgi:hypothetical protein
MPHIEYNTKICSIIFKRIFLEIILNSVSYIIINATYEAEKMIFIVIFTALIMEKKGENGEKRSM